LRNAGPVVRVAAGIDREKDFIMRSTTLITAVSLGLALAACGKKNDETATTTDNTMMTTDMNGSSNGAMADANMGATMAAMSAQAFTDAAVGTDMFEIQSGKLAETMATAPSMKSMAKMLVADHTKSSEMFKAAAKKTSPMVALPMTLPADFKTKLDALKATKGADFDKLYMEQQMDAHKSALEALKAYSTGGDQPSLKEFATNAVPVVQGHLDKMMAMAK
jgi:putative membrane protein